MKTKKRMWNRDVKIVMTGPIGAVSLNGIKNILKSAEMSVGMLKTDLIDREKRAAAVKNAVGAEIGHVSGGKERMNLHFIFFGGADAGKAGQNQITEGGMIVIHAAFVPFSLGITAQYFPCQPFSGKRIQIFINKRNGFAVFCEIMAGGKLMQQLIIIMGLHDFLLFIFQKIAEGG